MSRIDSANGSGGNGSSANGSALDAYARHAAEAAQLDLAVRRHVLMRLHEWHGIDPSSVRSDRPLAELGLTSRDAVALAAELGELAEVALPATVLWEEPTLDQLAR